ncbi:RNA-binding (RRM/RBD/RNP motifs) family protein [Zea mays]|uniref:RNA-binding (RRM/RBD/RNP motifs) family protein n=3 Tax=Zea mays TaxID=4577 RepID=A0A1D6KU66_MAIZE|nr:RNA-binding (RRM/RBD/RNP motifs) family protein [Zea mays]
MAWRGLFALCKTLNLDNSHAYIPSFFYCLLQCLQFCHAMQVKSVFLDGVPPHWDEDKVREIFRKFGEIDSIQLARNMFTAARKDFGFIGFTARQSALDCIKMVNKDGVGEGSGKVPIKASLQRPRHAFKKYSRQGSSSLLGVRRGFVDKSSSGRGHHSDRYRHFSPVRHSYSDNHSRRHSIDVEERHTSVRGYRAYYRRDSPVHAPSYKYGRTHLETRISEEYAEGRYTSKYPKHRYAMHGTMERDAYRRIKYGHSYQERAHRTCPDCKLCGQNYNYPNGEEFSAISGCQEAYYQTDRDLIPSTSQVASHCEGSCCKVGINKR